MTTDEDKKRREYERVQCQGKEERKEIFPEEERRERDEEGRREQGREENKSKNF